MPKNFFKKLELLLIVLLFFLAFSVAGAMLSRIATRQYSSSGIQIAGMALGNRSYNSLIDLLNAKYDQYLNTDLTLQFQDKIYTTTLNNLGLQFDSYGTVEKIYEYSYGANILEHLQRRISGLVKPVEIEPLYSIERQQMEQAIRKLIPQINDAQNANIKVDEDGNISVVSHHDGLTTNFDQIYSTLENAVANLEVPSLLLPERKIQAEYTEEQASQDAQIMASLLEKEIEFNHDNGSKQFQLKTIIKPDWLEIRRQKIIFHQDKIQDFIAANISTTIDEKQRDAIIRKNPANATYVLIDSILKNGLKVDTQKTARALVDSIKNQNYKVDVISELTQAKFINMSGIDFGNLQLLSEGRSNFAGSTKGRAFNINKGLSEKVNGIIVAPGEVYSFNSHLGPVTSNAGWQDALAIFGGEKLVPVPGGGLCQVSTTLYRAILGAGLEVVEASNHSLYVHYYQAYGDGLDATIYPGSKDLQFRNNTDKYLLIQAYANGNDAFVEIYGQSDGRRVELVGPMYKNKVPAEYQNDIKPRSNQIIWIQKIIKVDGSTEENKLVATYRTRVQ